jgi:hypothetical protein
MTRSTFSWPFFCGFYRAANERWTLKIDQWLGGIGKPFSKDFQPLLASMVHMCWILFLPASLVLLVLLLLQAPPAVTNIPMLLPTFLLLLASSHLLASLLLCIRECSRRRLLLANDDFFVPLHLYNYVAFSGVPPVACVRAVAGGPSFCFVCVSVVADIPAFVGVPAVAGTPRCVPCFASVTAAVAVSAVVQCCFWRLCFCWRPCCCWALSMLSYWTILFP